MKYEKSSKKTDSPYLKRDMRKFIQRQKKKNMTKQKKGCTTEKGEG